MASSAAPAEVVGAAEEADVAVVTVGAAGHRGDGGTDVPDKAIAPAPIVEKTTNTPSNRLIANF